MFNSIYGKISAKSPRILCIETGAPESGCIEWELNVADTTLDALPSVGAAVRIYTWLLHREDSMQLFGFSSPAERALFFDLLKVDGVGPKAALKIMSSISSEQLITALDNEDLSRLESVNGIGKKTAQKMLLTLKGKLTFSDERAGAQKTHAWQDVVVALSNMGYDKRECERVILAIAEELQKEDATFGGKTKSAQEELLFRRAIIELAQ
ncbi:MAG: Holliday junction branch migration protein RuvA [Treponemataceae bacterium]|nr:MAG: Holliday junction branch migration protein RuvA [Treponemataceae bacterium]